MSDANYSNAASLTLPAAKRDTTWGGAILSWTDAAGDPVDLTGASILFQVRNKPGREGRLELSLTSAAGKIDIANDGESATIEPVAAADMDLQPGVKYWEVRLTLADGTVDKSLYGTWEILGDLAYVAS